MADAESLSQFVAVTGSTHDQAQFYLDSANGDVDAAVSSFLDSGGAEGALQSDGMVEAPAGEPDRSCSWARKHHQATSELKVYSISCLRCVSRISISSAGFNARTMLQQCQQWLRWRVYHSGQPCYSHASCL